VNKRTPVLFDPNLKLHLIISQEGILIRNPQLF